MRAFIVTGPGQAELTEVERPRPAAGQVIVDVQRVGVCGTDVEFFTGGMAYLGQGPVSRTTFEPGARRAGSKTLPANLERSEVQTC
jgi:threonine dehydrogenase-like Zn-dependent dehydrogenase